MFKILSYLIKFIELFSVAVAARFTMFLASWPMGRSLKPRDHKVLSQGKRLHIKGDKKLAAWQYGESGPLVILIHGWEGHAAQLAPMAQHMASHGYRAVTFDVRAHGASKGKRVWFENFAIDMAHVAKHFDEPIHSIIAHSAGGLLTMMGRMKKIIQADYYAVLAAPRAPYPPLDIVKKLLGVSDAVLDYCRGAVAKQFESPWDELITGKMYEYRGQGQLMLIYDESDVLVHHTDADAAKRYWPKAHVIKTQGLGHFKILWDSGIQHQVSAFIKGQQVETQNNHLAVKGN